MGNVDKFRVITQHWIDHNSGHVAEFRKWQDILKEEDREDLTALLQEAIDRMDKVSEKLKEGLDAAGGPLEHDHDTGSHGHHHHHHH